MHRFWDIVTRPLLDAIRPATILEIGAEDGLHTGLLLPYAAENGVHLTVVDPILNERLAAVLAQYPESVTFIGAPSLEALDRVACPDIALIDGDHNWYTVYHELKGLAAATERDGVSFPVCLFHDIGWPYARRDLYYDPARIPEDYRHPYRKAGIVPGQSGLADGGGLNRSYCNALDEGGPRNGVLTAVEDFIAETGESLVLFCLDPMAGYGVLMPEATLGKHPEVATLMTALTADGAQQQLLLRVDDERIGTVIKLEEKRVGEAYLRDRLAAEREAHQKAQREVEAQRREIARLEFDCERALAGSLLAGVRSRLQELLFVLNAGNLHQAVNESLLASSRWKAGDLLVSVVERVLRMPRQSQSPIHLAEAHTAIAAARDELDHLGGKARIAKLDDAVARAKDRDALAHLCREINLLERDIGRLLRQSMQAFERAQEFSAMVQCSKRWKLGAAAIGFLAKASPRPVPTPMTGAIEAVSHAYNAWKGAHELPSLRQTRSTERAESANADARQSIPQSLVDAIRITQFTPPAPRNPFFTLVPHELSRRGWHFDYMTDRDALLARIREGSFDHEIVLFHHLDPLYHDRSGDPEKTSENGAALIAYLEALREAGARIVYNAHNPVPHASPSIETDLMVQEAMHRLATRVIVLGDSAADDLAREVPRDKLTVLHHPSFAGHYGPPMAKADARQRLGLPMDAVILGSIGELKPYKGISLTIAGYRRFRAAHPEARSHLLVAGREGKPGYADTIRADLPLDATLHAQEIPDNELPIWLCALDLGLFSFDRMWVSSSVLLALSYGVPVIAPDVGCIHEYAPEEDRGFLYEPGNAQDLAAAIARAVQSPLLPHMRYMCGVFNKKFPVTKIASHYEHFYADIARAREHAAHV